jgi:hypothetical protein
VDYIQSVDIADAIDTGYPKFKAQFAVYAENAFAMGSWIDRSTTGRS